jgi:flagellar biosynthesis protein FlhA
MTPRLLTRHSDTILAIGMTGILAVLLVPIPTSLMDGLIALNISFAVVILLLTVGATRPLDFSTFPSTLLLVTLLRLALNVASTRLILLNANAGSIITAFGDFVVGGNLVVGMVIFLILIVIQFVVITKGAGRISEVAARFTLDAMPGKQMAIDADLNAGIIQEEEAKARRREVVHEGEFYGAMDGAAKFVRGDAIAGIIITAINLVGGILIGLSNGMDLAAAARAYCILTVGDGLVTQIPSLVVATAAGIIVTKSASESSLGRELLGELFGRSRPVTTAAAIILAIGLMPGLPFLPFLALSVVLWAIGRRTAAAERDGESETPVEAETPSGPGEEDVGALLPVDRLAIEIGCRLVPLADPDRGEGLIRSVARLRKRMAEDLGLLLPPVRVRDNVALPPENYRILIGGHEVAGWQLDPDRVLAVGQDKTLSELRGTRTREPSFGLPAAWIEPTSRDRAEVAGCVVTDPETVLITHLDETVKGHAHEILSREDVQALLDRLRERSPSLVDEVVPSVVAPTLLQRVLKNLLRERISIRDLGRVLEALAEWAPQLKEPGALTERVRRTLGRTICRPVAGSDGALPALVVDPRVEETLHESRVETPDGARAAPSPDFATRLIGAIRKALVEACNTGREPVLLTQGEIRRMLWDLIRRTFPALRVVAYEEVPDGMPVHRLGIVNAAAEEAPAPAVPEAAPAAAAAT